MRKIKLPQDAHLMGEPSLVPPDFFPPKRKRGLEDTAFDEYVVAQSDLEEEMAEEEELLKQWEWYDYENNMDSS